MKIIIYILLITSFSSCATLFGGSVTECQRVKPGVNEPSRKVRIGALILDCIFWPSIIIDFATGAIYKPCERKSEKPVAVQYYYFKNDICD